jgi:hypothetical protein
MRDHRCPFQNTGKQRSCRLLTAVQGTKGGWHAEVCTLISWLRLLSSSMLM